jgi:predicted adenine nucleotide alpha hydrolase (AANH) superfamily ATPase
MESLLLHVCCGPCSTVPTKLLAAQGAPFAAFFENSNINSAQEFNRRLETFPSFAASQHIPLIQAPYQPQLWEAAIKPHAGIFPLIKGDPLYNDKLRRKQARCRSCYAMRFTQLAAQAATLGYGRISTTLSISPYQHTNIIAQELKAAAGHYGVVDAFVDYRFGYQESVASSRELSMYRQNYCGCRFSLEEAQLERNAHKAQRLAQKGSAHGK